MAPAQPFHHYLRWLLLERGKALDPKTWENYGRHLWDFASFLHANQVIGNRPFRSAGESVVRVYRDWQAHDLRLDPGTINRRLRIVAGFYRWFGDYLLDLLPFRRSIRPSISHSSQLFRRRYGGFLTNPGQASFRFLTMKAWSTMAFAKASDEAGNMKVATVGHESHSPARC
ncbi:hypothetical protein PQR02_27385 [Paraburkholderia sediminicola]|uniref:hypothetical protein n=1 Tax=Paraburkholderia sediminicola TaxID=458836 RepID=UPI0038BA1F27